MKQLLLLATLSLTLASCGAAGAPERPKVGAIITGEVSAGVQGSL